MPASALLMFTRKPLPDIALKGSLLFFCLFLFFPNTLKAQKVGYVDSRAILKKMPAYKEAQATLDKKVKEWEKEIQAIWDSAQTLESEYQAEEVLLTDEMRQERKAEIQKVRNRAKKKQKEVFGPEGLMFLKRKELVRPLQKKVFEAIEVVSKRHRVDMMFDKSGDIVMLYTNPEHDYTDYVLEHMGLGDPSDTIDHKGER